MQSGGTKDMCSKHRETLPATLAPEIRMLDLVAVWYQLVTRGWSPERILAADLNYRCFLQLVRDDPNAACVPSLDGDQFWHEHILVTELYAKHCQIVFGRYLHHYPFSGRFGDNDAIQQQKRFEDSQRRIAEMIGVLARFL